MGGSINRISCYLLLIATFCSAEFKAAASTSKSDSADEQENRLSKLNDQGEKGVQQEDESFWLRLTEQIVSSSVTDPPTKAPTVQPTPAPTEPPTISPTPKPTETPTLEPTKTPTTQPTKTPTPLPTKTPSTEPTELEVACEVEVEISCQTEDGTDCSNLTSPSGSCNADGTALLTTLTFRYEDCTCKDSVGSNTQPNALCNDFDELPTSEVEVACSSQSDDIDLTITPNMVLPGDSLVMTTSDGSPLPAQIRCIVSEADKGSATIYQVFEFFTQDGNELSVEDKFGSLRIQACANVDGSRLDCEMLLFYEYDISNVGTNIMDITLLDRTREGTTESLLDLLTMTTLQPGDSTSVKENEVVDLCVEGIFTTSIAAEADPPNGLTCFANDTFAFGMNPLCDIFVQLDCNTFDGLACTDLEAEPHTTACICEDGCARELIYRYTGAPCDGLVGCNDMSMNADSATIIIRGGGVTLFNGAVVLGQDVILQNGGECISSVLEVTVTPMGETDPSQSLLIASSCSGSIPLLEDFGALQFAGYTCQDGIAHNCYQMVEYNITTSNVGTVTLEVSEWAFNLNGEVRPAEIDLPTLEPNFSFPLIELGEVELCTDFQYIAAIYVAATGADDGEVCEDSEELSFNITVGSPFPTLSPESSPGLPTEPFTEMPTNMDSTSPTASDPLRTDTPNPLPTSPPVLGSSTPMPSILSQPENTPLPIVPDATQEPTLSDITPLPTTPPVPGIMPEPIPSPSSDPTKSPLPGSTQSPDPLPTPEPSGGPVPQPTIPPVDAPTAFPTPEPTAQTSAESSPLPTSPPVSGPTASPAPSPSPEPTILTLLSTDIPSAQPSEACKFDMTATCIPPDGLTSCNATPPPVDQCEGRPFEMGFLFNGGGCDQSFNVQEAAGKFFCQDFGDGVPTEFGEKAYIVVTDLDGETMFHNDWVKVGELFTLFDGGNDFPADQLITIYNSNDTSKENNIIQAVQYHSSCSQNLFLKDRFGASQLVIWVNEEQGLVSCFANQTFQLDITVPITLEGAPATLETLTVASNVDPFFFNLTNQIAGITVDAGDTIQTTITIPVDLTIKRTYNLLITLTAVTLAGQPCISNALTSFSAGYPLPPIFPTFSPTTAPTGTNAPTPDIDTAPCELEAIIDCATSSGRNCRALPAPESLLCENDSTNGEVTALEFLVTGKSCEDTPNCEDANMGNPIMSDELFIFAEGNDIAFQGTTRVGETIRLENGLQNGELAITISSSENGVPGLPLQVLSSLELGCFGREGQDLTLLQDYGALQLTSFTNNEQGFVDALEEVTMTYTIRNNGPFAATVTEAVRTSQFEGVPVVFVDAGSPLVIAGQEEMTFTEATSSINLQDNVGTEFVFVMSVTGQGSQSDVGCDDDVVYEFRVG